MKRREEERREAGGGGGMYDLTAHPNEYIKASFQGPGVPQRFGVLWRRRRRAFVLPCRRATVKAICPVAGLHPAAES